MVLLVTLPLLVSITCCQASQCAATVGALGISLPLVTIKTGFFQCHFRFQCH